MSTTSELIERANTLHADLMEKKKIQGVFWEKANQAEKSLTEASRALYADQTLETYQAWNEAYERVEAFATQPPPVTPDATEWHYAKEDALEAVARDAGLRLRTDL